MLPSSLVRSLRHVHTVALSALVLASVASANSVPSSGGGTPAEKPAEVVIKNLADKCRKLTQVVLHEKGQNEPIEVLNLDPPIRVDPNGGTTTIKSSMFNDKQKVVVSQTTWDVGSGLLPLSIYATVTFTDDTWNDTVYTLLYSNQTQISYGFTAASLAASTPVPENQTILVANGRDRSGHFPGSVVFLDAATQLPYTGSLTSAGQKEHIQVWTSGAFDGSGLTGSQPSLHGTGNLTSNGTVSLQLSGAEPGAMAVLVVGFSEIDVPFAGTTLGPSPRFIVPSLLVDEWGNNELTVTLGEMPKGIELYAQEFIVGPAGAGPVATNTVIGHSF